MLFPNVITCVQKNDSYKSCWHGVWYVINIVNHTVREAVFATRPPLPCPRGFGTAFGCGSLYSAPHRNRRTRTGNGTGTLAPRLPPRAPRFVERVKLGYIQLIAYSL